MPHVSDYTALLAINDVPTARWNASVELGTPVIVTYSFADGDNVPTTSESAYSVTGTSAFTNTQRNNFRDATAEFSKTAGIIFVEVDEGGMIDVSNAHGSQYGGWAEYPWVTDTSTSSGILVVDGYNGYHEGSYGFLTILHELGHALGLQHSHDGSKTLHDHLDVQEQTVMTYTRSYPHADELGTLDIQALRHLYGDPVDTDDWIITYDEAGSFLEVTGDTAANTIFGVAGQNRLSGGQGKDRLIGREDDDILRGGKGDDALIGGHGNDVLLGATGNDWIYGGAGNDSLNGAAGRDSLFGGMGADQITGGAGADKLVGGVSGDRLWGEGQADWLDGGSGTDTLYGGAGNDTLYTGHGAGDRAYGGGGNDILHATHADGEGDGLTNHLFGGRGNDKLFGGTGADWLHADEGRDTLYGGGGADTFVFDEEDGVNKISDFQNGIDRIDLSEANFDFADLTFLARQSGTSTLLTVDGADLRIYFKGVAHTLLGSEDFIF